MANPVYFLSKVHDFEQFSQFVHLCINDITFNPINTGQSTGGAINWINDESRVIQKEIQKVFKDSIVKEEISLPDNIPTQAKAILTDIFNNRRKDILNNVIKAHLADSGHVIVENFDWKLKWILGSSKLATIQEPICQIDLECVYKNGSDAFEKKTINFEMDLENLNKLIEALLNVKRKLNSHE
ncbi:COMM domain-containing protein 8-like [Rhynchophorus ferrugineus]|uniref:COMM domain-containing protein 8-like n=1 Tax=Rhynchophorus ferrugineus TaxID=354439 RepID=UPI003FCC530A